MTKKKEEAAPAASQPIDPSPFEFTPSTLAALFDPKSLSQLNQLGGLQGLEKGLKTSLDYGLREQGPTLVRQTTTDSVLSRISTKITGVVPDDTNRFPNDDLKQRVAVYGENKIPQRKTKSLLELMYIAMHDKIMVRLYAR
jgi:Ca2+-transporting ATPase